jgi:hypothetical protein
MGHCISIFLVKKQDIRGEKIDTIIDGKESEVKFTELGEDILATTFIPNVKEWGKDKMVARITTDYFGGIGSQSAKLFDNGKKVYDEDDEFSKTSPINDVLKLMGIKSKSGMDEFDTVGLGKYRSNSDFGK